MVKLPEENREKMILDIGLDNDFFGYHTKSAGNKSKKRQVGVHQTKKLRHSKGSNQQREKSNLWDGGKHLQTMYLISGEYLKYIRNSNNSKAKTNK